MDDLTATEGDWQGYGRAEFALLRQRMLQAALRGIRARGSADHLVGLEEARRGNRETTVFVR
jgi:hypothetical protein